MDKTILPIQPSLEIPDLFRDLFPIKKRTDEEVEGYSWERTEQQPVNIEVLYLIERPNITAVFGTSVPPSGLSGMIRREAFKYSGSTYAHWLPLILADRMA
ncbi:hypothetical protein [Salinimicrobium flavum]|uniref:Uncharacterized protein n=1 Tax=Salinimicrobium flavum TaxID=1737065 RepID=A0ABW5IV39_9FLAO